MTTATYSTAWKHTASADFQAWGSALSAAMQSCGLSQTTDTGQINWSTVAIPTVILTSGGYEIYKFTDALQATAPIFIKIEYGSGETLITPMIWITVGTGTNGAGALTGVTTTRTSTSMLVNSNTALISNTLPYATYICFDGSYLGVLHKYNSIASGSVSGTFPGAFFMVGRKTNPATGAYVAGGITCVTFPASPSSTNICTPLVQSLNTATATLYSIATGTWAMIPFSLTATAISGTSNYQIFPCYGVDNTAIPLIWCAYGLVAETTVGSTVSATLQGSTPMAYLMTGNASTAGGIPTTVAYAILMKYQ